MLGTWNIDYVDKIRIKGYKERDDTWLMFVLK